MDAKRQVEQLLGRYLSMRVRSEHEVRKYLTQKAKKYPLTEEETDQLLQKYKRLGFINDANFAESTAHSTVVNKAKGRRFLIGKLRQAGISNEQISQTVAQIDPEEVLHAMEKRLTKYEGKLAKLSGKEKLYKAYSYLVAAGFSSSEIRPFLDEWSKKR